MTPYIFHFISEASASYGGDRRKVIFSPMFFKLFGSIPGIAVNIVFCNEVFKMKQAMFNKLEDAKQFAKTVKELLCIKEPVMIKNKPTYIVVYK